MDARDSITLRRIADALEHLAFEEIFVRHPTAIVIVDHEKSCPMCRIEQNERKAAE